MEIEEIMVAFGIGLTFGGWCLLMVMLALSGYWVCLAFALMFSGMFLGAAGGGLI